MTFPGSTPKSISFMTVFGNGSRLFLARAGFFVTVSALLHFPLLAFSLVYPPTQLGSNELSQIIPENAVLSIFVGLITDGILSAVLTYVIIMLLSGRFVSLNDALRRGSARTLAAVLTSCVSSFCIGVGALLFVVPGLILLVWLFVAVPASVVENRWPISSMGRSRFLTQGRRWTLFGIIAAYVIASTIFNQIVALAVQTSGLPPSQAVQMEVIADTLVSAVVSAYYCVLQSYAYYLLVVEKDEVEIDAIARVFD